MRFSEYQESTRKTAIYPEADLGTTMAIAYTALGLANEAGEVAGKVKKILRDSEFDVDAIRAECGDVLWYLARLLDEMRIDFDAVAQKNLDKLADRQARGVIKGNGDNR